MLPALRPLLLGNRIPDCGHDAVRKLGNGRHCDLILRHASVVGAYRKFIVFFGQRNGDEESIAIGLDIVPEHPLDLVWLAVFREDIFEFVHGSIK